MPDVANRPARRRNAPNRLPRRGAGSRKSSLFRPTIARSRNQLPILKHYCNDAINLAGRARVNSHRSIGTVSGRHLRSCAGGPGFRAKQCRTATRMRNRPPRPRHATQNAIIVTAQKRAQVLIDVPQSVSVVSGETLEQQHAHQLPGLSEARSGPRSRPGQAGRRPRDRLRGVNTGGVASTVGVYVDETPFGSSSGLVNGARPRRRFRHVRPRPHRSSARPAGHALRRELARAACFASSPSRPSTAVRACERGSASKTVNGGDSAIMPTPSINVPAEPDARFSRVRHYRKDGGFIDSIGTGGSDQAKNINGDKSLWRPRLASCSNPRDSLSFRLTAHCSEYRRRRAALIEADPVTLKSALGGLTQSQFVPQFSNLHYRVYNATGNV